MLGQQFDFDLDFLRPPWPLHWNQWHWIAISKECEGRSTSMEPMGYWTWYMTMNFDLPLHFMIKLMNNGISGMGGVIDMVRKGCKPIQCWSHHVALNYDFHLEFPRSYFGVAISNLGNARTGWHVSQSDVRQTLRTWILTKVLTLDLQGQILK